MTLLQVYQMQIALFSMCTSWTLAILILFQHLKTHCCLFTVFTTSKDATIFMQVLIFYLDLFLVYHLIMIKHLVMQSHHLVHNQVGFWQLTYEVQKYLRLWMEQCHIVLHKEQYQWPKHQISTLDTLCFQRLQVLYKLGFHIAQTLTLLATWSVLKHQNHKF